MTGARRRPLVLRAEHPGEEFPVPGGKPSDMVLSVALANSGPVQVELIQQRNELRSIYRDFVAAGKLGLQHVAYWTEEGRHR